MKKLYLILGILLVIIIAVAAYLFFFRAPQTTPSGTGTTTGTLPTTPTGSGTGGAQGGPGGVSGGTNPGTGSGSLPSTGSAQGSGSTFGIVADVPALDYFVDASNRTILVQPDGKITAVTAGATSSVSDAMAQNILHTGFSFDGKKLFINFGDPNNPQTSIFDVSSTVWTPLGTGIISPVWSPSSLRLAYLKANTDGSFTLNVLDLSKKSAKPLALGTLHVQDVSLVWPNETQIIFLSKPSAYEQSAPLIYNFAKGTLSAPLPQAAGLETIWSNTTNTEVLAFTAGAASRGGSLALWSQGLTSSQALTIDTLPSKCSFHYENPGAPTSTATSTPVASPYLALYCAIPQDESAFANAALPDAYEQGALFTTDSLFKIRTDTGAIQTLLTPPQGMDMTNLKVFGSTLFFINRYNNRLYALSLNP